MKFGSLIACCGGFQMIFISGATAQSAAPATNVPYGIGNAVQQANEARQNAPVPAAVAPVLPQLAEPQFTLKDKETLYIRSIELEGPILVDAAEVREILASYEKRKLTLAQIYDAADKITLLYRNQGYLLAKAYVPAQDARGGVLKFKLVPGQYGTIKINNNSLVRDDYLRSVIDQALAGSQLVHKDELERAMMLISDLPGAGTPHVAVGAGQQPGTSDFVFDMPERPRIDGYLLGDNYGPGFTGRDRLTAGLNVNSPLGYGDKFTGFGIVSDATHLVNGRVAYSFPLGYDGLRAEVGAYRTTYVLGGTYSALDATGTADALTATLTYAMRRQRDDSIYLSANFTHKALNDRVDGTSIADRTIEVGTATISRDTVGLAPLLGLPLTTSTAFSFSSGYVNFADPTQKSENIAGVDTTGNFSRLNLSFVATLALNDKLALSTNLRAQKSLQGNLDSSEQMMLTGSTGVRSYDEGLAGDSGYLVTPELKYALPDVYGYHHSLGLFTDVGAAWLENASYTVTQRSFTPLYDVGLGYYATYEYSPGRSLLLKAQIAHTYGSDDSVAAPQSYDRHTKGLVQVGFTF